MSNQDPIVIVGAARTPMGAFQGAFSELAAHDLGGAAIRAAVERAGVAPEKVDEVLIYKSDCNNLSILVFVYETYTPNLLNSYHFYFVLSILSSQM